MLCHKDTSVHPLPPPLNYWYTSFFFLAGPDPLHEIAVSAFSRMSLGPLTLNTHPLLDGAPGGGGVSGGYCSGSGVGGGGGG